MNFIIDANNLAGRLGLLKETDFDKRLISLVRDWLGDKKKVVVLVFDSLDPLGDRISEGYLEIIYSPRDGYTRTADDKIIEIFSRWVEGSRSPSQSALSLKILSRLLNDDLVFVSDDEDLRSRIKLLSSDLKENVSLMRNDEFILWLKKGEYMIDEDEDENRGFSKGEKEALDDELLALWK